MWSLLLPIIEKLLENLWGLFMTIFIILLPFIFFPGVREMVGGEAFFIEHKLTLWAVFAFSGIFPVCVRIIRFFKKIEEQILTKREKDLLSHNQHLTEELETLRKRQSYDIQKAGKR
jgi:hypothetical protein